MNDLNMLLSCSGTKMSASNPTGLLPRSLSWSHSTKTALVDCEVGVLLWPNLPSCFDDEIQVAVI